VVVADLGYVFSRANKLYAPAEAGLQRARKPNSPHRDYRACLNHLAMRASPGLITACKVLRRVADKLDAKPFERASRRAAANILTVSLCTASIGPARARPGP